MLTCIVCASIGFTIYLTGKATDSSNEFDAILDADTITYASIFLFMLFIFWLARRDIKTSVSRSDGSEENLRSERNILEKRIAERTQALIVAEQARVRELERVAQFGTLSQGLFHDLMSPLSSLSLYMEDMAGRQLEPKESYDIVNKAVEVSRRMRSYIDNVKQCLGSESGRTEQDKADLSKELAIARDLLMYKARMADVQMNMICEDGIIIHAHPLRVQQLFLNLISNGIDACAAVPASSKADDDQRSVTVAVDRLAGHILIRATDNGCGIPAALIKGLFDRSFSTKQNGTGMGLTIIKSIVRDELKGSITAESILGNGTTFTVSFPCA